MPPAAHVGLESAPIVQPELPAIKRLANIVPQNSRAGNAYPIDKFLFLEAETLEVEIRDWHSFCPNVTLEHLFCCLSGLCFLPQDLQSVVCFAAKETSSCLRTFHDMTCDDSLVQGFWAVLRRGPIFGHFLMQRWSLNEIVENGTCPGCGAEVTSNNCFACKYAVLNLLIDNRSNVFSAVGPGLNSIEFMNACSPIARGDTHHNIFQEIVSDRTDAHDIHEP